MTRPFPRATVAFALAGFLLAAAGCVPQSDLPSDCDASQVERTATLAGQQLDPDAIDVCRGQRVTLNVTTQRDGVLHLHGYDDQGAAVQIRTGETAHLVFTASRAGQFPMEMHDANGSSEEVGILTVHEP
jgi:hypothetical protein